jgi:hypothetical protein
MNEQQVRKDILKAVARFRTTIGGLGVEKEAYPPGESVGSYSAALRHCLYLLDGIEEAANRYDFTAAQRSLAFVGACVFCASVTTLNELKERYDIDPEIRYGEEAVRAS